MPRKVGSISYSSKQRLRKAAEKSDFIQCKAEEPVDSTMSQKVQYKKYVVCHQLTFAHKIVSSYKENFRTKFVFGPWEKTLALKGLTRNET